MSKKGWQQDEQDPAKTTDAEQRTKGKVTAGTETEQVHSSTSM